MRLGLGFGLNRFAARVGVSASHLSRIERGLRGAQPEVQMRIAQGLGTTISAIRWETEGNDEEQHSGRSTRGRQD
jgi:transcriptional regulator with XRE-family HTH domain